MNFLSRPFWIFFCFISVKNPAHLYELSFFSALWMVFPGSWKRRVADFYAHDCNSTILQVILAKLKSLRTTNLFIWRPHLTPPNKMLSPHMKLLSKKFTFALSLGNWVLYKRVLDDDDSYLKFIIEFRKEVYIFRIILCNFLVQLLQY